MLKYQGDIAEIKFHLAAHERGFILSAPLRATQYDFLLDTGKRVLRIQVKSTNYKAMGSYRLDVRHGTALRGRYRPEQVDFILGYVHEFDAWYVIPLSAIVSSIVGLYPHKPESRGAMEKYRNAWHLLADST